jgi:hypothetical protein
LVLRDCNPRLKVKWNQYYVEILNKNCKPEKTVSVCCRGLKFSSPPVYILN